MVEKLAYNSAGLVTGKGMSVAFGNSSFDLTAGWTYDNEGRVIGESYPVGWFPQAGGEPWHAEYNFGWAMTVWGGWIESSGSAGAIRSAIRR
jgi:hypothetical protein